jgi:diguanylate cyclase (GGDEF)-like protein
MARHHDSASPDITADTQADRVAGHVYHVLTSPAAREEDFPDALHGVKHMQEVHSLLWGIRRLVHTLANGELEYVCKERGFVAGSLKQFQSNLRHLTWQAQCISRGEYHHRVNFLNDFSVAFNHMAEQLGATIHHLTNVSEEYKEQSHRDPLTNLYNRSALFLFAEQQMQEVPPPHNAILIMTDIDRFKSINDTYGHLCGDEVLREFTRKLLSLVRAKDICCRYGGEEFLILMPDTPLERGLSIAERLREAIEDMTIMYETQELRITASFGVSELRTPDTEQSFEERLKDCIHVADTNMYKAKSSGRNRVVS